MIRQLAHLCIHSKDLAKTEWFYCGVLGLKKKFTFEKDGEEFGFYIELGERTFIEVFQGEVAGEGNIRHMAIEVDDMEAVRTSLAEAGIEVGEKSFGADHAWQMWVKDPDGNAIEFHEYTAKAMQLTGGVCSVDWT
ncbi:Glyoxalase-like domain protein [Poriferisphaera corsica]|uniref:Glyoxalase-like domain protein n=1 Tax=Poriferisphaera corsica TaxID=2528020 RepID=A0A517YZ33_9BACT|nr:VOC family protein [Poriferisphaera corsica]QDU35484.1 Glyoxalase-like domain protein [Poriferisphaera corsica]